MPARKDPVTEFIRWIATAPPNEAQMALKLAAAVVEPAPKPRAPRKRKAVVKSEPFPIDEV